MNIKELKDYPLYYVSTDGKIYSKHGIGKSGVIDGFRELSPGLGSSGNGYYQVSLKNKKGKRCTKMVHRLIAEAFYGEIEDKKTVSHLDGDKFNNKLKNLFIESMSDNHRRKVEHGTDDNGCRNSRALVKDPAIISRIKDILKSKEYTHKEIGDMFGLSRVFITKINCGHRYKRM